MCLRRYNRLQLCGMCTSCSHAAVFTRLPQAPLSLVPEAAAVWVVRNVLAAEQRRVSWEGRLLFLGCVS
jgi:hypothetical protein